MADPTWKPLTLDGLASRLVEVRERLAEAAALAAATELARTRELAELVASDPRATPPVRVVKRKQP